jgi:hypothetical protein
MTDSDGYTSEGSSGAGYDSTGYDSEGSVSDDSTDSFVGGATGAFVNRHHVSPQSAQRFGLQRSGEPLIGEEGLDTEEAAYMSDSSAESDLQFPRSDDSRDSGAESVRLAEVPLFAALDAHPG